MKTILIVDDEYDISEAIAAILEADGFEVDVCSNGKEAIEYLKDKGNRPCLVLLDIMMPFVSGYEVLRFMKDDASSKEIPVIMMSAISPTAKQQEFGWNAFLKKPFNLDAFEKLVSELVKREASE